MVSGSNKVISRLEQSERVKRAIWKLSSVLTVSCCNLSSFEFVCCQTRIYKEWSPICLKETNNYARLRSSAFKTNLEPQSDFDLKGI